MKMKCLLPLFFIIVMLYSMVRRAMGELAIRSRRDKMGSSLKMQAVGYTKERFARYKNR